MNKTKLVSLRLSYQFTEGKQRPEIRRGHAPASNYSPYHKGLSICFWSGQIDPMILVRSVHMEYIHTQIIYYSRILFIQIHLHIASSVIYIGITVSLYMEA